MSDGKNILCRLNVILGVSKEEFEDTKAVIRIRKSKITKGGNQNP